MNYAISMQVLNPCENLGDILGSFFLRKGPSLQNLFIKVAEAKLHHKIDLIPSNVIAIGWQDIGMEAVEVYLHLVDQVLDLYLLLFESFDGNYHPIDVGLGKDDLTSLALPQLLNHPQLVPRFILMMLLLFFRHFLQSLVHFLQLIGNILFEVLP